MKRNGCQNFLRSVKWIKIYFDIPQFSAGSFITLSRSAIFFRGRCNSGWTGGDSDMFQYETTWENAMNRVETTPMTNPVRTRKTSMPLEQKILILCGFQNLCFFSENDIPYCKNCNSMH
jgi:hypothetical protein